MKCFAAVTAFPRRPTLRHNYRCFHIHPINYISGFPATCCCCIQLRCGDRCDLTPDGQRSSRINSCSVPTASTSCGPGKKESGPSLSPFGFHSTLGSDTALMVSPHYSTAAWYASSPRLHWKAIPDENRFRLGLLRGISQIKPLPGMSGATFKPICVLPASLNNLP